MSRSGACFPIEIDQGPKPPWLPADDRHHQGKPQSAGTGERLWRAANPEPDWQLILHRSRIDALSGQRRPVSAGPVHTLVVANLQQQIELRSSWRTT